MRVVNAPPRDQIPNLKKNNNNNNMDRLCYCLQLGACSGERGNYSIVVEEGERERERERDVVLATALALRMGGRSGHPG